MNEENLLNLFISTATYSLACALLTSLFLVNMGNYLVAICSMAMVVNMAAGNLNMIYAMKESHENIEEVE